MYNFAYDGIDLFKIRERLKKMTDDQSLAYGRSGAWLVQHGTRETWKVQLAEARAEWRRRHPRAG